VDRNDATELDLGQVIAAGLDLGRVVTTGPDLGWDITVGPDLDRDASGPGPKWMTQLVVSVMAQHRLGSWIRVKVLTGLGSC
jgi:hypothetical protein